jgi:hypothetical protein
MNRILTCRHCSEEFELLPGKPGFANECPSCLTEQGIKPLLTKERRLSSYEGFHYEAYQVNIASEPKQEKLKPVKDVSKRKQKWVRRQQRLHERMIKRSATTKHEIEEIDREFKLSLARVV